MQRIRCNYCGRRIAASSVICPNCKHNPRGFYIRPRTLLPMALVAVLGLGLWIISAGGLAGSFVPSNPPTQTPERSATNTPLVFVTVISPDTPTVVQPPTITFAPTPTDTPTLTLTPTQTLTPTITPSATRTLRPGVRPSRTPTPTRTRRPSATPKPSPTETAAGFAHIEFPVRVPLSSANSTGD